MSRVSVLLGLSLLILLLAPNARFAQQTNSPAKPAPTPTPAKSGDAQQPTQAANEQDNVVRISTRLVQVDAVVTDRRGNHVDDLKEEEFELSVDGKKHPLTYFKLTRVKPAAAAEPATPAARAPLNDANTPKPPTSMPTRKLEPEKVARTIAFVVDDLGLSFASTAYARDALKKFVTQQMQDGDLVAIIRTGRGLGALQQFTSDKRILYAAIDKLTWNPFSRDMIAQFGVNDPTANTGLDEQTRQAIREAQQRADDFRETVFSVGTLGAINFVVRGLRELPGRKMVVLISDGFRLFGRDRDNTQALDKVRRLVDLANRSSVVIYSIDAKGLVTLGPTAADDLSGMSQQQITERYSQQSQENFDSQEGLTFVARETGGFAVLNNNDISRSINRVLKDNESYYLIGFDPDDANFDRKFHSLKVRVTRPGLSVRSRAGFLGVPDGAPRPQPKTRDEQILATLYSPFGARDLTLQMTSFFFNMPQPSPTPAPPNQLKPEAKPAAKPEPKKNAPKEIPNKMPEGTVTFVRSYFHIGANNLTFTDEADGTKQLKLELLAFAFNEAGAVVDQHGRAFTIPLDEARYQSVLQKGYFYVADIPIKQPGAYQFRAVLRDAVSGRVGSATQFLQIPDLKKKHLAMSGLLLTGERLTPTGQTPATDAATVQADWETSVALRRFPRSVRLVYGFQVYNATLDPASKRPVIDTQTELYLEGKRIYQGAVYPLKTDSTQAGDPKRTDGIGEMTLNNIKPGDYMLRVVITDKLAKSKYAAVDQWMDFSVR